ncbi:unnamed protein product [Adineta steineri]|uniref:Major facilitator superfamily (MFS) profile domain-containing protein n=1 Tax=Adineta steineri TaxID=433720 RepID=A0A813XE76_9BILA|nr:unnamed protein product [Adineta steineri]
MYGCRLVAIIGACVASLGFFLSRWWANIWFYYITIGIIGGIGFALMYLPAIVSVNLYFEKKSAFALGIAISGSGVGTFTLLPQEPSEQRRLQRQADKNLISSNAPVISENNVANEIVEPMLPNVSIHNSPSKSFFGQIIEQMDLNLLKNTAFILFSVSNFLASLGFNVIYNFADDLANDSKVIGKHRTYIVMSIGLSSILGRVIIGYLGDRKWINHLLLFIITLIISGIATIIAPLCGSSVITHIGYASLFGFSSGGYFTLTSIVLVEIVGTNKLSDAFGVLLLFIGVAMAIGTPIVGAMRDAFSDFTQPFLWPYLIFSTCTVLSGVILFAIPFLQRKKPNGHQTEVNVEAP